MTFRLRLHLAFHLTTEVNVHLNKLARSKDYANPNEAEKQPGARKRNEDTCASPRWRPAVSDVDCRPCDKKNAVGRKEVTKKSPPDLLGMHPVFRGHRIDGTVDEL